MFNRIAIINDDLCQPNKCKKECMKRCPVNSIGKECITIDKKAKISENLCNGCNICTKQCPFKAISIVHIPFSIKNITHRYDTNGFTLQGLPYLIPNKITGIIGSNGIGKTTCIKIISKQLEPSVKLKIKGTSLQNIFTKNLKISTKNQFLEFKHEIINESKEQLFHELELNKFIGKYKDELSSGEQQRLAIYECLNNDSDLYILDEPTTNLDIYQRMILAKTLNDKVKNNKYIVLIEHDLSFLDYISDYINIFYGEPSKYGVCSQPYNPREGINNYLDGFLPNDKVRIRNFKLDFKAREPLTEILNVQHLNYPETFINVGNFNLTIKSGNFTTSQITLIVGKNGAGKSTFINYLSKIFKVDIFNKNLLYQYSNKTVEELIENIRHLQDELYQYLNIQNLKHLYINKLSGGELQRVMLFYYFSIDKPIYLLDEPASHLDSEQRIIVAKLIRKFIINNHKSAFVIEHDFLMSVYLSDQLIELNKINNNSIVNIPINVKDGMNKFLQNLNITLRRDPNNHRPRINKPNSQQDKIQRLNNTYFTLETNELQPNSVNINNIDDW